MFFQHCQVNRRKRKADPTKVEGEGEDDDEDDDDEEDEAGRALDLRLHAVDAAETEK